MKLIIALKKTLAKKKQIREMQEYSITMMERLAPLFNELKDLTENSEKKLINTELELRLLEDTAKQLSCLTTLQPGEEQKGQNAISKGKGLLESAKKRKEEVAAVENTSRQYNELLNNIKKSFDKEYKNFKKALNDSIKKANEMQISGSELLEMVKKSDKKLKLYNESKGSINIRCMSYYQ